MAPAKSAPLRKSARTSAKAAPKRYTKDSSKKASSASLTKSKKTTKTKSKPNDNGVPDGNNTTVSTFLEASASAGASEEAIIESSDEDGKEAETAEKPSATAKTEDPCKLFHVIVLCEYIEKY